MKLKVRLFGKNVFVEGSNYIKKVNILDYYPQIVDCKNCRGITKLYIKKGIRINDVVKGVKCSNCECYLEKMENR